jgi:uncharacterized protein YndB with AHSA1/START domain
MPTTPYEPGPAGEIEARPEGSRWTLAMVRELEQPAARVWRALTDPAELRQWAPFDAERDLGKTGHTTLTMAGAPDPEPLEAEVRRADSPRLLEYTWGEDVLRWELEKTPSGGTRLTLRHTLDDRSWIPKAAAGWHICLDVAERMIAGDPVGRIVGDAARAHGWDQLNSAYAASVGISDTGWPDEETR